MTVETEVASLTTAVDNLTSAVNVKKSTLDASVADALGHAGTASTHKTGAEAAKSGAESARDQAYTYSQSAASAVAYQDLTAIAESKSDTAKDVFVYDTSKDSDGGAWRKRTQGTSWYNETLNTSTRGSRKEFPAVAVIVAESSQVTIYDGDDPDLPMWMVFNAPSTTPYSILHNVAGPLSAVTAKDGMIVTAYSYNYGIGRINFISEHCVTAVTHSDRYVYNGTIAERNAQIGATNTDSERIVSHIVNDVAMTVLPNAPIDSATGLPVPTIAVATDGGVSVIKDDGSVVDITSNGGNLVAFTESQLLINYYVNVSPADEIRIGDIPTTDIAVASFGTMYSQASVPSITNKNAGNNGFHFGAVYGKNYIAGANYTSAGTYEHNGLTLLKENTSTPTNGSVAYITSDYNTGWMNGDIKLAALSDTDDTDVTGSELVTNGTFDSDTSGWSAANDAILSVVNGALRVTNNFSVYGRATQAISTVAGQRYTFVATNLSGGASNNGRMYVGTSAGDANILNVSVGYKNAPYAVTFTATGSTTWVSINCNSTGDTEYQDWDNISVRLADSDRSVNGNGLQVHGTITKTAVATGAELVAYSGFSTSNYLEQPYNSDLDFGTGDFSIMLWAKLATSDCTAIYTGTSSSNGINVWCYGTAIKIYVAGQFMSFSSTSYIGSNFAQFTMVRKSGVVSVYTNGELSVTVGAAGSIVYNTMKLGHGHYSGGGAVLALFRASATAPTAEQIAKIYEDEKPLFQENAKATLYGTSDAVTALAHDDSTNLLHVGTSAGRSVFQGLRRVDNTTDAVGACISASNNLVVED